ncbi:hypothetical protein OAI07_01250 [Akkermansiaceae bacterium]|nr:hypothetical protein [Akkermansiaceae bacterium]
MNTLNAPETELKLISKIQSDVAEAHGFLVSSMTASSKRGAARTCYTRARDVSIVLCKHLTKSSQASICNMHGLDERSFHHCHAAGMKIIKSDKRITRSLDNIIKKHS